MYNCIVLCGGGTAGHVMPNIALLKHLKKHFKNIYYIGSTTGIEKEIISKHPEVKYFPITSVKLIRGLNLKNLLIPFKLLKGYNQSKVILKKLKPDIVFSKGGYVSVPVTFACKSLNIPVVAHESDFNLGLANKLILKTCTKMCCSFEQTAKSIKNGVFTLSPVRDELFMGDSSKARKICNFNNTKPTLLVIGGSLGAKAINECMFKIAEQICQKFNVIHIVGKGNKNNNIKPKNYYQIEFTPDIQDYFQLADIVISRAGSNAINEFLVLGKPMLLIPLPKGNSRGDQLLNSKYFVENGFAIELKQEEMNEQSLMSKIEELYKNRNAISQNQSKYKGKNGTKNILKVILESIDNR